jgi:ATPase subunit of ABC transporter with duplicated ATPase domains
MITTSGISLRFGKQKLFSDVSLTFSQGNCYGLIGANGSGKSTFLKILSGELESTAGDVVIPADKRMAVLKQDQFAFDEYTAINTVIMGHKRLYDIICQKEELYAKDDFSDKDGIKVSELEEEFGELDGWSAESNASKMLSDLGMPENLHEMQMSQLEEGLKVRVLLAQALFANPDILILDEPTNHLDIDNCIWLEEFLCNFKNTAIVVSHDRHFLDKICTHIADIDYGKIQIYPGNFTFWYESSQLSLKQRHDSNKKLETKREELKTFIARFSANASKSKQATSRKKLLEKLTLDDIKPSSRKSPYINFEQTRDAGNNVLKVEKLSKTLDGEVLFKDLSFTIERGDKVAFVGSNNILKTNLFEILMKEKEADSGNFMWGVSTNQSFFPKDNTQYFESSLSILHWLCNNTPNTDERDARAFLGRMLFSGEDALKKVNVLSGGEKVRCMLSRMMRFQANVLILDQPTNHLDLESITALDDGLVKFPGTILFASHDHKLINTVANRIIEITPKGFVDRSDTAFDDYLASDMVKSQLEKIY